MNKKTLTAKCSCIFCEDELKYSCVEPDFCEPCEIEFIECKKCGQKYAAKLKKCPNCAKTRK